jgi:hypothetical protein
MKIDAEIRGFFGKMAASIRNSKPATGEMSQTALPTSPRLPDFGPDNVGMKEIYRRCYNNDFGVGLPPVAGRVTDLS